MIFNKLVSVIVPAFNHEKYIESCLESIYRQSYRKIELIIINDGSSDNTDEKIVSFIEKRKKRFKNITYVNRRHEGIGETLNELIDLANGEYLFQIASDDMAKEDAVKTLYGFLKKNKEYALVVGDNDIIDDSNKRIYWSKVRETLYNEEEAAYKTFGDLLKDSRPEIDFNSSDFGSYISLLKGNYIPNGKMFRKSALLKVGGYKKDYLEDWYINIKLSKEYKLKFIDRILFSYRWHDSNTIKNTEYIKRIEGNMEDFLKEERSNLK